MNKYLLISLLILQYLVGSPGFLRWKTIESRDGSISCKMPGEPEKLTQTKIVEDGSSITFDLYIYEKDNIAYLFSFYELFGSYIIEDVLNESRDGAINNVNGKLLIEKEVEYKGHLGRDIRFSVPNIKGEMHVRYYIVNNFFIQIGVAYPESKSHQKDFYKFFESLKIDVENVKTTIENLLTRCNFNYDIIDNGTYYLRLNYDDNRSQIVYLSPKTISIDNSKNIEIWSYLYISKNDPPANIYKDLLYENGKLDIGKYQVLYEDSLYSVLLSLHIPIETDLSSFQKAILRVSEVTDEMEKTLFTEDTY